MKKAMRLSWLVCLLFALCSCKNQYDGQYELHTSVTHWWDSPDLPPPTNYKFVVEQGREMSYSNPYFGSSELIIQVKSITDGAIIIESNVELRNENSRDLSKSFTVSLGEPLTLNTASMDEGYEYVFELKLFETE